MMLLGVAEWEVRPHLTDCRIGDTDRVVPGKDRARITNRKCQLLEKYPSTLRKRSLEHHSSRCSRLRTQKEESVLSNRLTLCIWSPDDCRSERIQGSGMGKNELRELSALSHPVELASDKLRWYQRSVLPP